MASAFDASANRPRIVGPRLRTAMALAVVFILLLWQVAAWSLPDFLMPDVHVVFGRLWEEIGSTDFRAALGGSLARLGTGYAAALVCGVVFGLVGAVLSFFREVLRFAIVFLQSFPSLAWVPLFLLPVVFASLPISVPGALVAFIP